MGPVRPSTRLPTQGARRTGKSENRLNDQDLLRLHAARKRSFLLAWSLLVTLTLTREKGGHV